VIEGADGTRETIPWPSGTRPGLAAGFGFCWLPDGGQPPVEVFDLCRQKSFVAPMVGFAGIFVRPGAWVLRSGDSAERFDPETGKGTPLALPEGARVEAIAGDGRVIVTSGASAFLLDPDSGAREVLTIVHREGGETSVRVGPADWRTFHTPARTPSGADVFTLRFGEPEDVRLTTFARRDGARLVACPVTSRSVRLVAIPDDDHVLVIADDVHLERWRFGSAEIEVLFRVGGDPGGRGAR